MKAEEFHDFEVGYRAQANKHVSLDVAAFAGLYKNLEAVAAQAPQNAVNQNITIPYTHIKAPYLGL